jgi:methionyl-tRNA formyltransferase
VPQDLSLGSYYGGRKPEDGRIDWDETAEQIHNLVRGVAPPYPGAFTTIAGKRLRVLRSKPLPNEKPRKLRPALEISDGRIVARCGDGGSLWLLDLEFDDLKIDAGNFSRIFGSAVVPLGQGA